MAVITPIAGSPAAATLFGTTPTNTGDTIPNSRGRTLIGVNNGSGGSINVTITPPANTKRPADGQYPEFSVPAIVIAVGNGAFRLLGPFPKSYNNPDGSLNVLCSAVSSVGVSAHEVLD